MSLTKCENGVRGASIPARVMVQFSGDAGLHKDSLQLHLAQALTIHTHTTAHSRV
jgi:hypothetical protein